MKQLTMKYYAHQIKGSAFMNRIHSKLLEKKLLTLPLVTIMRTHSSLHMLTTQGIQHSQILSSMMAVDHQFLGLTKREARLSYVSTTNHGIHSQLSFKTKISNHSWKRPPHNKS